ncbi:MAG: restriction endonuclease subunit S [Pirellulaceae bacterium]
MKPPTIKLGDAAITVDYGVTASAADSPVGPKFLRITDIQNGNVDWNTVPWCEADTKTVVGSTLEPGDIVFARTGATTGKSFLIRVCPENSVFASYLIRLRLKDSFDPRFVSHFFQTPDYWAQITKSARGVAQPGVNATTLKSLDIPTFPLSEQKRISEILDRAEALRAKRRAALALLDELTQSIFLDMFGDPVTNPKGWPVLTLEDVAAKITDGEHLTPTRTTSGIKLLSARNVRDGYIDFENVDFIGADEHERIKKRCNPEFGDILISCSGTIGRVAMVRTSEAFSLVRSAALVKPKSGLVESAYLESHLRTAGLQTKMQQAAHSSSQANLFQGPIRRLPFNQPPIELQRQYSKIVDHVRELKNRLDRSQTELDQLFASLQHRAFRGEI